MLATTGAGAATRTRETAATGTGTATATAKTTSAADEQELVAALRRGDDAAYAAVVRANTGRLLAVAKGILRNPEDANEAVQEAFLQAFRAIDRFEGEAKLSTWLHRITVNACLLRLRHAKRHPESPLD